MGHPIVFYLMSLAVGYWLLTLAEKQNGHTKTLGLVLAWIIMIVSVMGPVCIVTASLWRCAYGRACYYEKGGWGWDRWCPGMNDGYRLNGECPQGGPCLENGNVPTNAQATPAQNAKTENSKKNKMENTN